MIVPSWGGFGKTGCSGGAKPGPREWTHLTTRGVSISLRLRAMAYALFKFSVLLNGFNSRRHRQARKVRGVRDQVYGFQRPPRFVAGSPF